MQYPKELNSTQKCAQVFNSTKHTSYLSFFYTHTFSGLKILHWNVRKFATKIASRQNSVNQYWRVKLTYVFNFVVVIKFKVFVKLQRMYKPTPSVYNYTLCVKLHAVSLCVKSYLVCKVTLMCKITHFVKLFKIKCFL